MSDNLTFVTGFETTEHSGLLGLIEGEYGFFILIGSMLLIPLLAYIGLNRIFQKQKEADYFLHKDFIDKKGY
jgi:hypothetical protein